MRILLIALHVTAAFIVLISTIIIYNFCISLSAISPMPESMVGPYVVPVDSTGVYHIVIKKSTFTLSVYLDSTLVKTYPCAVGKNTGDKQRAWDYCTPEGNFYVQSIEPSSYWKHDFKGDGQGPIKGAYGPWFYRLYTGADSTKSGLAWKGIAIHGTHAPASIGTRASEGCIRLKNEDILDVKQYIYVGIPVRIEE